MKKELLLIILFAFSASFSQVGINTDDPKSTLDLNGSLSLKVVNLSGGPSGSATLLNDGVYFSLTPNSGSQEFIVPNAASVPGRTYIIRNVSNTIDAQFYSFGGSFFSKSSNTSTTLPLTLPGNAIRKTIIMISDGLNWTYFE